MYLFLIILEGQAIEWFSHLPPRIKIFQEIIDHFVAHFSYNLDTNVRLEELYTLKQKKGELFASFLQWWRHRSSKYKWPIPEKQQVEIIVGNMETNLPFQLRMQCVSTYEELISKGINIERGLITKRLTRIYKNNHPSSSSRDKPHTWAKNKNVTNDGVVDAKVEISDPTKVNTQK